MLFKKKDLDKEIIIRNGLIISYCLTLISTYFSIVYSKFSLLNYTTYNDALENFFIYNQLLLIIFSICVFFFALYYFILALRTKKDRVLKIFISLVCIFSNYVIVESISNMLLNNIFINIMH